MAAPLIAVFDFDHTVVDDNTDTVIPAALRGTDGVPEIREADARRRAGEPERPEDQWTHLIGRIIAGHTAAEIAAAAAAIPLTPGMEELFAFLARHPADTALCVVSDSNTLFIGTLLERLLPHVPFAHVVTNPIRIRGGGPAAGDAVVDGVEWCMESTHDVEFCTARNMCKGALLRDRVLPALPFAHDACTVVYVGDGGNDLCPVLTALRPGDVAYARAGFRLSKALRAETFGPAPCGVCHWSTGGDILRDLEARWCPAPLILWTYDGHRDAVEDAAVLGAFLRDTQRRRLPRILASVGVAGPLAAVLADDGAVDLTALLALPDPALGPAAQCLRAIAVGMRHDTALAALLGQRSFSATPWLHTEITCHVALACAAWSAADSAHDFHAAAKAAALDAGLPDIVGVARRALEPSPTTAAQWRSVLQRALWGNTADLSLHAVVGGPAEGALVADDLDAVVALLRGPPLARVDIVLDNAGTELIGDLALALHLRRSGAAHRVVLHGKPLPYFVSDATSDDVGHLLEALRTAGVDLDLSPLELRFTDAVWCYPAEFRASFGAPGSAVLRELRAESDLVVFKGDLNYRRLVGDRHWGPGDSFAAAVAFMGRPAVLALRTLKSPVLCGVPSRPAGAEWRCDGSHGAAQFAVGHDIGPS